MQDYRKLHVWQKAHALTLRNRTPFLATSERSRNRDFRRFLWHSLGSCNELEYDFLLARDLGPPVRCRSRPACRICGRGPKDVDRTCAEHQSIDRQTLEAGNWQLETGNWD